VTWVGPPAGAWEEPANWSTGAVPTAVDSVVAGETAAVSVTHGTGSTRIRALSLTGTLRIAGGSLTLTRPSRIDGQLIVLPGASLSASGAQAVLTVTQSAEIGGANLLATGGGRIVLPGATRYAGAGLLRAEGAGSRLELSGVSGIGIPRAEILDIPGAVSRELSGYLAPGGGGTGWAISGAVSRELSAYLGGGGGAVEVEIQGAISRELTAFSSGGAVLPAAIRGAESRELSVYRSPADPGTGALREGLLAHWRFEGSGTDSSGADRDLDVRGAGYGTGLMGQGLALSGSTASYAIRPVDDGAFDFGSGDFAIQVWVDWASSSGEQVLVEKFQGASGPGWTLTKLANNAIGLHFGSGGSNLSSAAQTLATGVWHQVLVNRQGQWLDLYLDGARIAHADRTGLVLTDVSRPLLLGRRNDGDGRGFASNASFDEVAVWSRARDPAEIARLWNGGAGAPLAPLATGALSRELSVYDGSDTATTGAVGRELSIENRTGADP
jgi:hypothetical protein